jgi:adenosylhomocysteine nucleosidase
MKKFRFVILISADAEWKVVLEYYKNIQLQSSPYGDWFSAQYPGMLDQEEPVILFHGGWGKVAAAGSTQYVIDRWQPDLIVNIGTCGGFEGLIEREAIILAEKTIIYDIYEQMGDPDEHLAFYSTVIDLSWIEGPLPIAVQRGLLVSGDRDLMCDELDYLKSKYRATAGDWESGAIAWVAQRNHVDCLILRGVTDLVSEKGGEAYNGQITYFYANTQKVMRRLLDSIPQWLAIFQKKH